MGVDQIWDQHRLVEDESPHKEEKDDKHDEKHDELDRPNIHPEPLLKFSGTDRRDMVVVVVLPPLALLSSHITPAMPGEVLAQTRSRR